MLIKFINIKSDIICRVNNRPVPLYRDGDSAYVCLDLKEGKHCIQIQQKTFYITPVCYVNIFNPLFFIWQLRFLDHNINSPKSIPLTSIHFEISNKEEATILLNMSKKTRGAIDYIEKNGLKDYVVCKQSQDFLQIQRYKKTHIFSSAFYMLLLNILCIVDGFSNGKIGETILFCLLLSLFSLGNIRRVSKQ